MAIKYTKKVMEHFTHPHNVGEIKNADAVGRAGNPICGDILELFLNVKNNKITNIKFKTLGCAAAIATYPCLQIWQRERHLSRLKR
jgi:nitrogen fixation NifU-like protein